MPAATRSADPVPADRRGTSVRAAAAASGRGVRGAATATSRRVRAAARADGAESSGLSALLGVHALHAAGDALVAVALTGTLFFSVPIDQAKSRVALYLLLTMLPFALLVPVAGPVLDRFPHGRRAALAVTTGGRGLVVWAMATETGGFGLYPMALAVLVLSRAYQVARSSAVPRVRPPGMGLVSANARLNMAAVGAGAVAAAAGAELSAVAGSGWVLRSGALVLVAAAVLALRLPEHVDEPVARDMAPPGRLRLLATRPVVTGPLAVAIAMRALAGLLTLFLAFLLRAEGASGLLVGGVVGAAAGGQLVGTALSARLPERAARLLGPGSLLTAFATCLFAAVLPAAGWVVLAAGAAGAVLSVSKFSLDAALQTHVRTRSRSTAFARSETLLQLAWVAGGAVAVALPPLRPAGFAVAATLAPAALLLGRRLSVRAGYR